MPGFVILFALVAICFFLPILWIVAAAMLIIALAYAWRPSRRAVHHHGHV